MKKREKIQEKDIRNKVTKYKLLINANLKVSDIKSGKKLNRTFSSNQTYIVDSNYSNTVNNLKEANNLLIETIVNEILDQLKFTIIKMIFKSFEVENNINIISKFKCILIYGENIGLKEGSKKLVNSNKNAELINLYEEDFLKNKDILTHETQNISLFTKEKLIIINQANEKILTEIDSLLNNSSQVKILLISEILDKKSKLRSFFEKKQKI